jgi:hypothetical protein
MKRFVTIALLAIFTMIAGQAFAAVPKGALGAIAVSPDGTTIVAAGDNRVLYVLDAEDLSVQGSIWIGINPLEIHFSNSGETIVIHDTKNNLVFYSTKTWKPIGEVSDANSIAVAEKADIIVASGRAKGRDEKAVTAIYGYSLATGKQVISAEVAVGVHAIGVLSDASRIFALSKPIKTDKEKKEKPPANLKGLDKEEFKQKHDGKYAQFVTLDKTGKELGRYTTWYSSSSAVLLAAQGKSIFALNYSNINAELDRTGKQAKLFKSKNSYNYGMGYSATSNVVATGGMGTGSIMNLADGTAIKFKTERIGGWPEYFKGFAIAKDGTTYGGTTAYRLVKIWPDGKVEMVKPVF